VYNVKALWQWPLYGIAQEKNSFSTTKIKDNICEKSIQKGIKRLLSHDEIKTF